MMLTAAAVLTMLTAPVKAGEYTFSAESASEYTASDAFDSFIGGLPEELRESVGDISLNEAAIADKLDLSLWLDRLVSLVTSGAGSVCGAIVPLFSLVLLMAVSNAALPDSDVMKKSFTEYASLVCAAEVFRLTSSVLADAQSYLDSLCGIMNLFFPVMETVCLLSGSVTEKAVSGGAMILLTTLIGNFTGIVLAPLVSLLFTFSAVTAACPDSKLGSLVSGIRKFIGRLWAVMGILFSFLLSVQTLLAKSADSLGARTARFAVGSFIPVAGGMLSEALSTVQAGMAYIRQAAGIGGILVLLALFLPGVVPLLLYKLALSLTASAADILGASGAAGILGEVRGIVELIIGVVIAASLLFLLALMMFAKVQAGN